MHQWPAEGGGEAGRGGARPFERRTAALIAYLAVEGPTARSRLAGLLWGDVPEATARSNLRQALRRLRLAPQGPRVRGDDALHLDAPLDEEAALHLLRPHDFDDLPEFSDWLLVVQERRRSARVAAVRRDARRLEDAGDLRAALDATEVWLDLEPVAEDAHRQLMRLHHLLGDRAGALAAYQRCRAALRRELGLDPTAQTRALAEEVARAAPLTSSGWVLPLSVQRPPVLIGRAAPWVRMEHAWAEGKAVIVSGEAGVGKSRLLQDFLAAHGRALVLQGRPGDHLVPYSTLTRGVAALLRLFPDLPLPAWVRQELARLLPDLGPPPAPLGSDADKLRFYQAHAAALRLAGEAGLTAVACDDLHWVDAASAEAALHALTDVGGEGGPLRALYAHRPGALAPGLAAHLDQLVSAGLAVRVDLTPLPPDDAMALLDSLHLPELQAHGRGMVLAAGGNPLALLETARHLLGPGGAGDVPERLGALMAARLSTLSPAALNLARAAAILEGDLTAETASVLLGVDALNLTSAWGELQGAQVLRSAAFTHDLLGDAVRASLPDALRALLHRRAADVLERLGGAPARVAAHWDAGGEPERAAVGWRRAGEEAEQQYRYVEAAERFERAWRQAGAEAAFTAGVQLARVLRLSGADARLADVVTELRAAARTPAQHAAAAEVHCQVVAVTGDGAALEAAARRGLEWAREAPGCPEVADLLSYLGTSLFFQHRLEEALTAFREAGRVAEATDRLDEQCIALGNEAAVLGYLGRRMEARAPLQRAQKLLADAGRREQQADVLLNLGNLDVFCGHVVQAERRFAQAQVLLDDMHLDGATPPALICLLNRAGCARLLEHHGDALRLLEQALSAKSGAAYLRPVLLLERARTLVLLGADAQARACLAPLTDGAPPEVNRAALALLQGLLAVRRGRRADVTFDDLSRSLRDQGAPLDDLVSAALAFAPLLPPARALEALRGLPEAAEHQELFGLRLALLVRQAQAQLALGELTAAEAAMAEVRRAAPDITPACPRAEVLFTHARILAPQRDPGAATALQEAREALLTVADQHVPAEHRTSFLALPLNAALLGEGDATRARWRPLSDAEWDAVAPLLDEAEGRTGRPRRDTRAVLDGVRWALATGAPWSRPFPAPLPSAATCYRRYREWEARGALQAVQQRLNILTP